MLGTTVPKVPVRAPFCSPQFDSPVVLHPPLRGVYGQACGRPGRSSGLVRRGLRSCGVYHCIRTSQPKERERGVLLSSCLDGPLTMSPARNVASILCLTCLPSVHTIRTCLHLCCFPEGDSVEVPMLYPPTICGWFCVEGLTSLCTGNITLSEFAYAVVALWPSRRTLESICCHTNAYSTIHIPGVCRSFLC